MRGDVSHQVEALTSGHRGVDDDPDICCRRHVAAHRERRRTDPVGRDLLARDVESGNGRASWAAMRMALACPMQEPAL